MKVIQSCEKKQKKGKQIKKQKAKLRNNAIFAKSIGTPTNKIDKKIVTTRKKEEAESGNLGQPLEQKPINKPIDIGSILVYSISVKY